MIELELLIKQPIELELFVKGGIEVRPNAIKGDKGDPGEDGREVEIQKSDTHIQWRYVGDQDWIDLVALDDIRGIKGDPGDPGDKGDPGEAGAQPIQVTGVVVSATGWSQAGDFQIYPIVNANITAQHYVDVIPDNADYKVVRRAEILPATISVLGSVFIVAVRVPTSDITVTLNIVRWQ
jgi:hypothetical protein